MKTFITAAIAAATLFAATTAHAEHDSGSDTQRTQLESLYIATGDPVIGHLLAQTR